jgi:hypothetical protein
MNQLNKKYKSTISPIMMIPGLKYLLKCTTYPMYPKEIIFSYWECLPNYKNLSQGIKMYYYEFDENKNDEIEYYCIIILNKYGAQAGMTNYIFYKDYD